MTERPTDEQILANASRLFRGSEPADWVDADAFVIVIRKLSDPCFMMISGPYEHFETAQRQAMLVRGEFVSDGIDDEDEYFEIRPVFADAAAIITEAEFEDDEDGIDEEDR